MDYTPVWNTLVNDFCDFIPTYGTIRQYGIHFVMTFAILYRRIVYYTPVWNTLFNDFRDFIPTYRTIRQYGIHCFPLFPVKKFLHQGSQPLWKIREIREKQIWVFQTGKTQGI